MTRLDKKTASEIECVTKIIVLRVSCHRFDGLEFVPNATHAGDLKTRLRRMAQLAHDLPNLPSAWRQGGDFVASYRARTISSSFLRDLYSLSRRFISLSSAILRVLFCCFYKEICCGLGI